MYFRPFKTHKNGPDRTQYSMKSPVVSILTLSLRIFFTFLQNPQNLILVTELLRFDYHIVNQNVKL